MLKTTKTQPSLALMVVTLTVVMLFAPCNGLYNCYGNWTPCICDGPVVTCDGIPAATVKSVFSKITNSYIDAFFIYLPNIKDSNTLMADLIGDFITFTYVRIECRWRTSPLTIDANAFRSTKSVTYAVSIHNCNLSRLNWGFIHNFTGLQQLILNGNDNFLASFYTLPSASLTRLSYLELVGNTGLNNGFLNLSLRYPEPLKRGLYSLRITDGIDLNDFALNCFLIKWVTPYSKNTLIQLDISANNLTKIPNEVRKYNNLATVNVNNNLQPWTIQKNAFNITKHTVFYNVFYEVTFFQSKVTSIQPGAFQGYYGNYRIELSGNQLTTFDEGVFKTILQQHTTDSKGSSQINIFDNPFDCSSLSSLCKLAWLIRDNPSYLNNSKYVGEAQCTNGTYFKELSAMALRSPICP